MKVLEAKEKYFSVKDAAIILGVSERRVLQFINHRRIHAIRFGKSWAIPEAALRSFSTQQRHPGRPKSIA